MLNNSILVFIINILPVFYWAKVFLKRTERFKVNIIHIYIFYVVLVCLDDNNCDSFLVSVVNVFVNKIDIYDN